MPGQYVFQPRKHPVYFTLVWALMIGCCAFGWRTSQQKHQKEELLQEKAAVAELLDSMTGHGFVIVEDTGRVVEWNRGAERITKWKRDEVVGKHITEFMDPQLAEHHIAFLQKPIDSQAKKEKVEVSCVIPGRFQGDKGIPVVISTRLIKRKGHVYGVALITEESL